MAMQGRSSMPVIPYIDTLAAQEKARLGALDEAVELARSAVDEALEGGSIMWSPVATRVLVETLLKRGGETDLWEAKTVIDKLAAIPTDPRLVLTKIWLLQLRALLAQAQGDDVGYRDHRDRYRKMANELDFEGHMAWAEAMA